MTRKHNKELLNVIREQVGRELTAKLESVVKKTELKKELNMYLKALNNKGISIQTPKYLSNNLRCDRLGIVNDYVHPLKLLDYNRFKKDEFGGMINREREIYKGIICIADPYTKSNLKFLPYKRINTYEVEKLSMVQNKWHKISSDCEKINTSKETTMKDFVAFMFPTEESVKYLNKPNKVKEIIKSYEKEIDNNLEDVLYNLEYGILKKAKLKDIHSCFKE